jgi:hypothetical protein
MVASTSVPVLTRIALALSWVAISSNSALSIALNKASGGHAGSPLAEREMLANRRSIGAQSIKSCRSSSEQRRPASELPNAKVS